MMKKNIKNEKGITIVTLVIAIMIMIIITATIIFNISTSNQVKALNDMYQDITILKDKVDLYYSKYHDIPILQPKYENINKIKDQNPNDNSNYYVIDIEAVGNVKLTYGKDYKSYKTNPVGSLTDIYIVNERSHNVYYVQGIELDEIIYYTIPQENTKVELNEILQIEEIGSNMDFVNIKMYAVNKASGIKSISLMINNQLYKTYKYDSNFGEIRTEIEHIKTDTLSEKENICFFQIEDNNGSIKKSNSIIVEKRQILIEQVEIGDYVAYNPIKDVSNPNLLTYTSNIGTGISHGNGHSKQVFTATDQIKWRVLNKDEQTGEIVLISEAPIQTEVKTDYSIRGGIGYLYIEQELNEICKIYGYGKGANTEKTFMYEIAHIANEKEEKKMIKSGARSINVKDINIITGYNNTQGNSYSHHIYCPTIKTETGISKELMDITETHTAYYYLASSKLPDKSSTLYQMLFRNITNTDNMHYFLASRCVNSEEKLVAYDVFYINNQDIGSGWLVRSLSNNFYEETRTMGVRPVVYLKPNILTNGKNDQNEWIIVD